MHKIYVYAYTYVHTPNGKFMPAFDRTSRTIATISNVNYRNIVSVNLAKTRLTYLPILCKLSAAFCCQKSTNLIVAYNFTRKITRIIIS